MKTSAAVAKTICFYVIGSLALYPAGVLCHELVGHGMTGVLFGGRIAHLEILGLELLPNVAWIGWQGHYGTCDVEGIGTETGKQWMAMGGSLSTGLVAVFATLVLLPGRRPGLVRSVLICLSLWWMDMFTYTLPSWGLRRSVFWGQRTYSEPYDAAVALGLPGWLFQIMVVAWSAILTLALAFIIVRDRRRALTLCSEEAARKSQLPAASP